MFIRIASKHEQHKITPFLGHPGLEMELKLKILLTHFNVGQNVIRIHIIP